MRFVVLEERWALDALNPVEWHFLCELPGTAAGVGMDASIVKNRLFPSPLDDTAMDAPDSAQQIEDWDEYVQPEIETAFDDARKLVSEALSSAETLSPADIFDEDELEEVMPPDGNLPDYRRLLIPFENVDAWYSVLNQARLLMNEEHDIAESMEHFAALLMENGEEISPEKGMLFAQYEMYSAIQNILVENLMN